MRIAIRENDIFPEEQWADWIQENPTAITEEPYNYQIIEISDNIDLKILRYEHFELAGGQYFFNQTRYNAANGELLSRKYVPSETESVVAYVRTLLKAAPISIDETKMQVAGLYESWQLGNYAVGDIRNYAGQTWECHQAHDNAVYPDITPDNPQTWATFWRPLHGKTKETARPWVKPWAGTTDIYHTGEVMVYTDGKIYRCKADTVYSPEEYAQDWEEV